MKRVIKSFSYAAPGRPGMRTLRVGDVVPADDPAVASHPDRFESLAPEPGPVVEQASAAPGEKRSVPRRPRAKDASGD